MPKKDIDWGNLPFSYMKTDYSYVCNYKDGAWGEGFLTEDHNIVMSECAGILHYCQEVFEGLKAYTTEDGRIVCFRPDLNAQRMADSAERLCMPVFPQDRFVEAVKQVVAANADWVPPFGSGATLYVRPFMFASGEVIGVKPADEYQFRILVTPVGPYFKGGDTAVTLGIAQYDRAAPHGTGNIKAGLNYAMSLKPGMEAHAKGYAENMYLDSQSRTYVEETGGANTGGGGQGLLRHERHRAPRQVRGGPQRRLRRVRPVRHRGRHQPCGPCRRRRRRHHLPRRLRDQRPRDEEAARHPHRHPAVQDRGPRRLGLRHPVKPQRWEQKWDSGDVPHCPIFLLAR